MFIFLSVHHPRKVNQLDRRYKRYSFKVAHALKTQNRMIGRGWLQCIMMQQAPTANSGDWMDHR